MRSKPTQPHMMAASNDDDDGGMENALGMSILEPPHSPGLEGKKKKKTSGYDMVPDPNAEKADLSDLRGTKAPTTGAERKQSMMEGSETADLEALAEIVPALKHRAGEEPEQHSMTIGAEQDQAARIQSSYAAEVPIEVQADMPKEMLGGDGDNDSAKAAPPAIQNVDSMKVEDSCHVVVDDNDKKVAAAAAAEKSLSLTKNKEAVQYNDDDDDDQNLGGFDDDDSDIALPDSTDGDAVGNDASEPSSSNPYGLSEGGRGSGGAAMSSEASLSTATQTQTHEVRMPMYLPTFKPATGCTNASDFIVRCFVARLRSGITVVKHGRSRWCKSRLRILHIHPDGRSLSWKPAVGEPTSSKRPPKLDLSTCMEVRHAWSPDPLNPMFTGTAILRQKCEAANAHKSFALIFPKRTVDITAVTADQCKVLMEGFSALCFRLQVANLAGRKSTKSEHNENEDAVTTTASVTLTNNSTTISPTAGGGKSKKK